MVRNRKQGGGQDWEVSYGETGSTSWDRESGKRIGDFQSSATDELGFETRG
jgi:hypothetical protein